MTKNGLTPSDWTDLLGLRPRKEEREAGLANVWEPGQVWRNSPQFSRAKLGVKPEQSTIIGLTPSD